MFLHAVTCFVSDVQFVIEPRTVIFKNNDSNATVVLVMWSSAHGFGSAAVASGDADLLPFCLVAYILMGTVSSLAVSIPVIRTSVLQL
jgi:hypothetical protein